MRQVVFVLDYGSQYSQLIARRLREEGVYSELVPPDFSLADFSHLKPAAFILSGGPDSVWEEDSLKLTPFLFSLNLPILGICYGMQLLAFNFGGQVEAGTEGEFGGVEFEREEDHPLFRGLPCCFFVWMSHGDRVLSLPAGFRSIGRTGNSPIAALSSADGKILGLQFHPEVEHTQFGQQILHNFLFHVAELSPSWSPSSFLEECVAEIRARVNKGKVLCALSGGVDSTAVAFLLQRAIPGQFSCLFVDTGLLRFKEREEVEMTLCRAGIEVNVVDAQDEFLSVLKGVLDPEEKRRRIGELFVEVFAREAKRMGSFRFLAQGTIYPDVVESRGKGRERADKIKTHHNVGGLPERLPFDLLEPLGSLFKDEVRELGRLLGIPEEIVSRQPFPGPGLAVRVVGEVTKEKLEILKRADGIFRQELCALPREDRPDQYFAVLLPVRAVGVMGDRRAYGYVLALRAVHTHDFMTADWSSLSSDLLARVSRRVVNEVPEVSRVVYDITSKPPATIEWE